MSNLGMCFRFGGERALTPWLAIRAYIEAQAQSGLNTHVVPSGQALRSKLATAPVYVPGVCQASGGEPVGDAVPVEPSTFCCLPAGT